MHRQEHSQTEEPMSEDERAIRELIATWIAASKAEDTETVLGLMADGVLPAQLYPLAGELVGSEAVSLWAVSRFTQTIAGIAAAAAQEWEAA